MKALATREPINVFLKQIEQYPVLSKEQEYSLAIRYYEEKNLEAANELIVSNLRFVIKVASEYLSYGFQIADLVQEGTIGLMKAVKKFNPYKGYRLISYAVWWIRATIQNHIMKFWSQVKIGTTQAQRKLFQKIGRAKKELNIENSKMTSADVKKVADLFGVKVNDVADMELRMASRDFSLDATLNEDGTATYMDTISDDRANQEDIIEFVQESELTHNGLEQGLDALNEREQMIIENRYLANPPAKLRELGHKLGISKERVRQIEVGALKKLKNTVKTVVSDSRDSRVLQRT